MKIQSINPATGRVIKEFKSSSKKDLTEALKRAKKSQKKWAALPKEKRIKIVSNLKKVIEKEKKALINLIHEEIGVLKPEIEGIIEGDVLVGFDTHIKDYQAIKTKDYSDDLHNSNVEFIPQGVIGHIGIWNYPFWQAMVVAIPGLLTGNAIVYKPAEYATLTGLKIIEMIHRAGVPKDVYLPLVGGPKIGKTMVKSEFDMIAFTGGIKTGLDIIKNAGVKPLILELSGNDAAIVCSDIDFKQAIPGIIWGAFQHGGQDCVRVKRVFVVKKIAQNFLKALVKETKKLRIKKDIGPLIREEARNYVHRQVQEVIKRGAKLLIGGEKVPGDGFFYKPTLLLYERPKMKMYEKEIFGSVTQIQIVKDENEAIKLANDTIYGLGGTVWSSDIGKAKSIARQIDAGTVWINDAISVLPCGIYWGGMKASGIASSQNRVQAFLKKRAVIINKGIKKRDWWYPYK